MPRRARSTAPDPPGLEPARLNRALNQCPRRRSRSSLTCLRRATQAARPRPRMLNSGLRPSRDARRPSPPARRPRSTDPAFLRRRPLLPSLALCVPPWRGHAPRPMEPRPMPPLLLPPWTPGYLTCVGPCGLAAPKAPPSRLPPGFNPVLGPSESWLGDLGPPRPPALPDPIPFPGPPRSTLPACPARLSRLASVTPLGPPPSASLDCTSLPNPIPSRYPPRTSHHNVAAAARPAHRKSTPQHGPRIASRLRRTARA